jgi:hypothetical protein
MKWPRSWYVEQRCEAPDACWAAKVASRGEMGKHIYWSKGVVAGPLWYRRLIGDTRPPLFPQEAHDDSL